MLHDNQFIVVDLCNSGLASRNKQDVEIYRRVFDLVQEKAVDVEPFLDKYQELYVEMRRKGRTTATWPAGGEVGRGDRHSGVPGATDPQIT